MKSIYELAHDFIGKHRDGATEKCAECGDVYYRDEMRLAQEWNCLPCLAGEI